MRRLRRSRAGASRSYLRTEPHKGCCIRLAQWREIYSHGGSQGRHAANIIPPAPVIPAKAGIQSSKESPKGRYSILLDSHFRGSGMGG